MRNYEINRSTFSASVLKQNVNSEKDLDEQSMIIARLKNEIATLEKANFRLQIDKRDAAKDNKNLRRRSREHSGAKPFIPKGRISTIGKENNATGNNATRETINIQRKNLLDKFNKQKYENEDIGSNSASVIFNSSDIEECSGKKKI